MHRQQLTLCYKAKAPNPAEPTHSWKNILAKTDLNTALCHRQCLLPLPPLCSWQSAQLRMLASLRLECSFTQCFESSLNSWGILSNSIESKKFEFKCKQLTQVKLRWPWPETPIAWFTPLVSCCQLSISSKQLAGRVHAIGRVHSCDHVQSVDF